MEDTAKAYFASVVVTATLYPYRDYVKSFNSHHPQVPLDFVTHRYRGVAQNPQPILLLGTQWAALFGSFSACSNDLASVICGGFCHATTKVVLRHLARRLQEKKNRHGDPLYDGIQSCIARATKDFGIASWFCGLSATTLISCSWHGGCLVLLRSRDRSSPSFFSDWWAAFRLHSVFTLLSNPLRNSFRSALHSCERSGGVPSVLAFLQGEAAVFREAGNVAPTMLRTVGVKFFAEGALRTTFKTSIPFSLTYALFRFAGGSLGGKSRRSR